MHGFNYKKTVQALNYLASISGGSLNKMKAIKLLWLSDRLHLRKYARTITGDTYFALKLGPVPSNTRDILENSSFLSEDELKYSSQFISITDKYKYASNGDPYLKVFSETDIEILNEVFSVYGQLSHFQLSELSHEFPEWKKWEASLKRSNSRYLMNFSDFFQDTPNKKELFIEEHEDLQLIKSLFERTQQSDC